MAINWARLLLVDRVKLVDANPCAKMPDREALVACNREAGTKVRAVTIPLDDKTGVNADPSK